MLSFCCEMVPNGRLNFFGLHAICIRLELISNYWNLFETMPEISWKIRRFKYQCQNENENYFTKSRKEKPWIIRLTKISCCPIETGP